MAPRAAAKGKKAPAAQRKRQASNADKQPAKRPRRGTNQNADDNDDSEDVNKDDSDAEDENNDDNQDDNADDDSSRGQGKQVKGKKLRYVCNVKSMYIHWAICVGKLPIAETRKMLPLNLQLRKHRMTLFYFSQFF